MVQSSEADHDDDRDGKKKSGTKTKDVSHVPCKFFKVGACTAGQACPFSHTSNEPGQQKQICNWFVKGSCKFGHKCALAHVLPGQPMSMDRKNKKAAQQQAQQQAGEKQPAGKDGERTPKSGDKDKPHKERSGQRERSQNHHHSGGKDGHSTGNSHSPSGSSSNHRSPLSSISKGPAAISASVLAPPVTSAASDFSFDLPDDFQHNQTTKSPLSGQQSLFPAQAQQARQNNTGNTATPPSSTAALLAAQEALSRTPVSVAVALDISRSPDEDGLLRPSPSEGTPGPRRPSPLPLSPSLSATRHIINRSSDLGFGPVGSPPRTTQLSQPSGLASQLGVASITNNGPGALSNILAGLAISHGIGTASNGNGIGAARAIGTGFSPSTSPATRGFAMEGISSSLSNAPPAFASSPFSAPGSKSLFMSYGESTATAGVAGSPLRNQFSSNAGYPASFAGSRAFGWDSNMNRRPSLPGQNVIRNDLAASASLLLDESALEEDDIEAEEFLPSSLNELLTNEERERRYSRTGARPSGVAVGDMVNGARGARKPPVESQSAAHSRSVPAQSLMTNVKALWENKPSGNDNFPPSPSFGRTVSSNAVPTSRLGGDELFSTGNHGPSPSLLSSSHTSNASNAFLRDTMSNQPVGGRGFDSGRPTSGLTSPLESTFQASTSYNPQSTLQNLQYSPMLSQQQPHSASTLSRVLYPNSSALSPPVESLNSSSFYGLHQPHPTHHRSTQATGLNSSGLNILSPTTRAMRSHAHEPGSSLPRGLGAGLSRLHLVPASAMPMASNSSNSPTTAERNAGDQFNPATGSPGISSSGLATASPSYAAAAAASIPTSGTVAWGSPSTDLLSPPPRTAGTTFASVALGGGSGNAASLFSGKPNVSETGDRGWVSSNIPGQPLNKPSTLAARLAAAGITSSSATNSPLGSGSGTTQPSEGTAPSVPVPPATMFSPRRNVWGQQTAGPGAMTSPSSRPQEDDRDIDEALFSMD